MADLNGIRSLYADVATSYERHVIPAVGPLAYDLATWIARCAAADSRGELYDPFDLDEYDDLDSYQLPGITALDVGTGTGILARTLARTTMHVIGTDISPAMLNVAVFKCAGLVECLTSDLHQLPLRRASIGLIVASFGLNTAVPKPALRSLVRVLRPGGLLIFQEWGVEDDLSHDLDQLLEEYVENATPTERTGVSAIPEPLQTFLDMPKPWYNQLQDAEDYYDTLKQIGFRLVWVKEKPFVTVHFPSVNTFMRYKLAWPSRRLPLAALPIAARTAFQTAVRAKLTTYANSDGSLDWSPSLFRVCASL